MASAVGAETAMMNGRADRRRLLHHLDRNARGDDDRARRSVETGFGQRPGQLVQRVVPADILARRYDALAGNIKAGGVHRAGLGMQRLRFRQKLDRLHDVGVAQA